MVKSEPPGFGNGRALHRRRRTPVFSLTTEAVLQTRERGTLKYPWFQCARCFRLGRPIFEYRVFAVSAALQKAYRNSRLNNILFVRFFFSRQVYHTRMFWFAVIFFKLWYVLLRVDCTRLPPMRGLWNEQKTI